MIETRSVATLQAMMDAIEELQELNSNITYTVWKRGRLFTVYLVQDARDDNDDVIGEIKYEGQFKMMPLKSASRNWRERWIVFIDLWKARVSVGPSSSDTYTRPDSDTAKRKLRFWLTKVGIR